MNTLHHTNTQYIIHNICMKIQHKIQDCSEAVAGIIGNISPIVSNVARAFPGHVLSPTTFIALVSQSQVSNVSLSHYSTFPRFLINTSPSSYYKGHAFHHMNNNKLGLHTHKLLLEHVLPSSMFLNHFVRACRSTPPALNFTFNLVLTYNGGGARGEREGGSN